MKGDLLLRPLPPKRVFKEGKDSLLNLLVFFPPPPSLYSDYGKTTKASLVGVISCNKEEDHDHHRQRKRRELVREGGG